MANKLPSQASWQKKIVWKLAATLTVCGKSRDLPYNGQGCPSQKVDQKTHRHHRLKCALARGDKREDLLSRQ